ncbi:MAG: hypothetical protein OEY38_22345, partial [Gammaproteobacteria bacterium]|nr:hypothetical protein [Gammaproteobacteria bacterium]
IVTNYALTAEKAVNDLDYEKKAFIPVQSEDLKQRRRDFNLYANRLYQDNKAVLDYTLALEQVLADLESR